MPDETQEFNPHEPSISEERLLEIISKTRMHAILKALGECIHNGLADGTMKEEDVVPLALRDKAVYEQAVQDAARKRARFAAEQQEEKVGTWQIVNT